MGLNNYETFERQDPQFGGLFFSGLPAEEIGGVLVLDSNLEVIEARPNETLASGEGLNLNERLWQADAHRQMIAVNYWANPDELTLIELPRKPFDVIAAYIEETGI